MEIKSQGESYGNKVTGKSHGRKVMERKSQEKVMEIKSQEKCHGSKVTVLPRKTSQELKSEKNFIQTLLS